MEKHGASVPYKYVFDAKYRIENNPEDPFYPDSRPGPKVGDINTMHRYRDSIVYENDTPSRFMFEKIDHCNKSYQLFAISSEEEYRLMSEINKVFKNLEASTAVDNTAVYRINDQHSVIVADGFFTITTDSGEVLDRIAVSDFSRSPRAGFRRIKNAVDETVTNILGVG